MLALLVELRGRVEIIDFTVDPHTAEALAVIVGKLLAIFTLSAAHHRGQQIEPCAVFHGQQNIDHLADGLAADGKSCRR